MNAPITSPPLPRILEEMRAHGKSYRDLIGVMKRLSIEDLQRVIYDWDLWAMPHQRPPDSDWYIWLLLAGRGSGKGVAGAQQVIEWGRHPELLGGGTIILAGRTYTDVRKIMVEGPAGIMKLCPPELDPIFNGNAKTLTFRATGVVCDICTGDKPDSFRGPNGAKAWLDEIGTWPDLQITMEQCLEHCVRVGPKPQIMCTTTGRPRQALREFAKRDDVTITRGSMLDNVYLSKGRRAKAAERYGGTVVGRQELLGDIIDDNRSALWDRKLIARMRVKDHPPLTRPAVAIDPAASDPKDYENPEQRMDETGISVGGMGSDGVIYIKGDHSDLLGPKEACKKVSTVSRVNRSRRVVVEGNNGGAWIPSLMATVDDKLACTVVKASTGKLARADPVAVLCEQDKIKFVGEFPDLEDELCNWDPGNPAAFRTKEKTSPNRMDAFVWLCHFLSPALDETRAGLKTWAERLAQ